MLDKLLKFINKNLTHHNYDKIIFLDFDGVLCPINDSVDAGKDRFGTLFDANCIKCLNDVITTTNAQIVVTSSWRQYLSLWQLRSMWHNRGMKGRIVDVTPIRSIHRGNEIDTWLSKNNCHRYVIIDDMNETQFNEHHVSSLVVCDGRNGFSKENAQKAIIIFTQP